MGVVASVNATGNREAALVGVAATDEGTLV